MVCSVGGFQTRTYDGFCGPGVELSVIGGRRFVVGRFANRPYNYTIGLPLFSKMRKVPVPMATRSSSPLRTLASTAASQSLRM